MCLVGRRDSMMCKGTLGIKTSKQQRYGVSWESIREKSGKTGGQQSKRDFNAVQAVRIYPLGDKMLMKKFNQGSSVVKIPLKKKIPQWP